MARAKGDKLEITPEELDALIARHVADAVGKRVAQPASDEAPLPLHRQDCTAHPAVVRALLAIAAHVGMDTDPTNGYTPFESAIAKLLGQTPTDFDNVVEE